MGHSVREVGGAWAGGGLVFVGEVLVQAWNEAMELTRYSVGTNISFFYFSLTGREAGVGQVIGASPHPHQGGHRGTKRKGGFVRSVI